MLPSAPQTDETPPPRSRVRAAAFMLGAQFSRYRRTRPERQPSSADAVLFASDLPKTRSGKIMRRLLKDIAEGRALGDTTTLADPGVVARLKNEYEAKEG